MIVFASRSRMMDQIFYLRKEAGLKTDRLKIFPRGMNLIFKKVWGSSSQRILFKDNVGYGERQFGRILVDSIKM
jgi:hypothetical protein